MTFINGLFARFETLRTREEGQTMAEYGVVLAVITLTAVVAYVALGDSVFNTVNKVVDYFK
jgi:Flp pilus assembly pilin Flp